MDGLELYFASDRQRVYPDYDLYVLTRASVDEEWSGPANLGPGVNNPRWEQNPDGAATEGTIWCFTVADYVIVDNFETYFHTLDPWSGYSGASVALESAVVREGVQSMGVDYRNTFYPCFTKVERTWDEPQDWTRHGPKKLTLWYYLKPNVNTAIEPLFQANRREKPA